MNKKKRTTYLFIAVILIYGAIVARFFMLRSDGEEQITSQSVTKFTPISYGVKENFEINNDYRDPFLGKRPAISTSEKITKKPVPNKETAYYPDIVYRGVVADSRSSAKVLSLTVNGKEYIIREGKTADSVRVISGDTKKITVAYKGNTKKFDIAKQ